MWSSTQPYGFWDLLVLQGSSFKSVAAQPTASLWIGVSKKAKNKSRWGWIWAIEPVRHWWSEPAEWGEQAWVPLPIERWGEKQKKKHMQRAGSVLACRVRPLQHTLTAPIDECSTFCLSHWAATARHLFRKSTEEENGKRKLVFPGAPPPVFNTSRLSDSPKVPGAVGWPCVPRGEVMHDGPLRGPGGGGLKCSSVSTSVNWHRSH